MAKGTTFVFIHGSWHGAWCWYKVLPLLEQRGHHGIAIDLPGHGRRWEAPATVTMQHYVDAVTDVLDQQDEPVVLVGHSRGGIVVSQVAEARPEKISKSVYLAAYLIANGAAMLQTAMADEKSVIVSNLMLDEEAGHHMLKAEAFRDALYHDCPPEDVALASHLLTPEPNAPVGTPLQLTEARFGSVPRIYIQTDDDRGLTPAVQQQMQETVGVKKVHHLATSHSPFLSQPEALVELLVAEA